MLKTKKLFLFFVVLVIVLLFLVSLLSFRLLLPVDPAQPYFTPGGARLGGVRWLLGEFQPVYLYSFEKNEDYFIKVAYRDKKNKIKLIDVFVGGSSEGVKIPLLGVFSEETKRKDDINTLKDYGNYFKFGNRLLFTYLRNTEPRDNPETRDAIEFNPELFDELCGGSLNLCYAARQTSLHTDLYWEFQNTGSFGDDIPLYVISISKLFSD